MDRHDESLLGMLIDAMKRSYQQARREDLTIGAEMLPELWKMLERLRSELRDAGARNVRFLDVNMKLRLRIKQLLYRTRCQKNEGGEQ